MGIRKAVLSIFALAVVMQAPGAQAGNRIFPVDAKPVLEDRYPQRLTHWPAGVTSLADVTYQTIRAIVPRSSIFTCRPARPGPNH